MNAINRLAGEGDADGLISYLKKTDLGRLSPEEVVDIHNDLFTVFKNTGRKTEVLDALAESSLRSGVDVGLQVLQNPSFLDLGTDSLDLPPNRGFAGKTTQKTLQPGEVIGRSGSEYGKYASPLTKGERMAKYDGISLPYMMNPFAYHRYRVLKPFDVEAGTAAPYFGRGGGGQQYLFSMTIRKLIENGYIQEIK